METGLGSLQDKVIIVDAADNVYKSVALFEALS